MCDHDHHSHEHHSHSHSHSNDHGDGHSHDHSHAHDQDHAHDHHRLSAPTAVFNKPEAGKCSIVVRTPSGLSGDMLLTGLAMLAGVSNAELASLIDTIGLPALHDVVEIKPHSVNAISGWHAHINLPAEHHHRSLKTIHGMIDNSQMPPAAKQLAKDAFSVLGQAEADVHGIPLADVHFHEVGALDSILDTCTAALLLTRINPVNVYCSPLPLCDGMIKCEHGILASPAPAVQEMLRGVPVYGIDARGETITPTAIAFLKAAFVKFGKWPQGEIINVARAYGSKVFVHVPNGAMFFLISEKSL